MSVGIRWRRCEVTISDQIATASAMPRNDGKGADEDGERPDIPSRPKTRLLAGPRNDGKSANEDREFLVLFAEKSTGEIEFEN